MNVELYRSPAVELSNDELATRMVDFDAEFVLAEPIIKLDPEGEPGRNPDVQTVSTDAAEIAARLDLYDELRVSNRSAAIYAKRVGDKWHVANAALDGEGAQLKVTQLEKDLLWKSGDLARFMGDDASTGVPDASIREFWADGQLVTWWITKRLGTGENP